jgi:recombination protein RecA
MSNLDAVLAKLYKSSGFKPSNELCPPRPVPTPSPSINWAIGGGIYPGLVYCLEGEESSGKSYFAMECIKELLKSDPEGIVLWYDSEFSFAHSGSHWRDMLISPDDHKRIAVLETNDVEKIFDDFNNVVMDMVVNGKMKVLAVVLDSIQGIKPPAEAKAEKSTSNQIGDLSKYLPKAFRMIIADSRANNIPWFMISQVRQNLDPNAKYTGRTFVTSGGQAFKHHTDVEMFFHKLMSKDSKIFGGGKNMNDQVVQLGHTVRVKVWKSKVCAPYRIGEFRMTYQQGIVQVDEELFRLAYNLGVISREGNYYYFNEQKLGLGKEKAIEMITASPELKQAMFEAIDKVKDNKLIEGNDVIISEED